MTKPSRPKGIILLEGADCSGKSTLAKSFVETYGAHVIHSGVSDDVWHLHMDNLMKAIELSQDRLVVLDRLWLSECAYGFNYRGGAAYPVSVRCIDRLLLKHAALTILCVPGKPLEQIKLHKRLKEERHEEFSDIRPVVQWYYDLWKGHLAQPGDDYGSQFVRFGDFHLRPDVMRYDMQTDGTDLKKFMKGAIRKLEHWRESQWAPLLTKDHQEITGHVASADTIFVGEELSPRAEYPYPFVWSEEMSAATYFNRILHEHCFREWKGLFVNAQKDGVTSSAAWDLIVYLHDQGLLRRCRIVTLGKKAADYVNDALSGVMRHIAHDGIYNLKHPQYIRRFKHHTRDYSRQIYDAVIRR